MHIEYKKGIAYMKADFVAGTSVFPCEMVKKRKRYKIKIATVH